MKVREKNTCLFHFKAHVVNEKKSSVVFLSLVLPQSSEFDSSLKLEGWKNIFSFYTLKLEVGPLEGN